MRIKQAILWPNLAIALGAVLGASMRFSLAATLATPFAPLGLPLGTLVVNLAGCFLIGVAQSLFLARVLVRRELQLLVTTGFLGGLTTFSSVSVESIHLIQDGLLVAALGYWLVSLLGGISAALLGVALVNLAFQMQNR